MTALRTAAGRTKWTMDQFKEAQEVVRSGMGSDEQRVELSEWIDIFEQDVASGWAPSGAAPAQAQAPAPAPAGGSQPQSLRAAGGEEDYQMQEGGLVQAPKKSIFATGTSQTQAEVRAELESPVLYRYDQELRSASKRKNLYAKPIYDPGESGEVDPETGQPIQTGETDFFYHQEPTAGQAINYLERAADSVGDEAAATRWKSAIADIESRGEDSSYFQEFADRQWQEVYRVFAERRAPVMRVAYSMGADGDVTNRMAGEFVRAAEPFVAGGDQMATLGAGTEVMANYVGNKRYGKKAQDALSELEESGTLMPFRARVQDIMDNNPLMTGTGMVAGALIGAPARIAQGLGFLGKAVGRAMPNLLRGTSLSPTAAAVGEVASRAGKLTSAGVVMAEAGTGALVEETLRGELSGAGRMSRGEEGYVAPEELSPGAAFGTGALGGALVKGATTGIDRLAKNLRLRTSEGKNILAVEAYQPGKRGTDVISGVRETPEMRRVAEAGLDLPEGQAFKVGEELGYKQMRQPVAKLGAELEEAAVTQMGREKQAFYTKHQKTQAYMHSTSKAMLDVFKRRKDVPIADEQTFLDIYRKVTTTKAVGSEAAAKAMRQAAGGGEVMPLSEAKRIFPKEDIDRMLGRLKEDDPSIPLGSFADPIELDVLGRSMGADALEPNLVDFDALGAGGSPVWVVAIGKKLNPRDFDTSVSAVDLKVRYGQDPSLKDKAWRELGASIRKDRSQFGEEWVNLKKRHSLTEKVLDDRKQKMLGSMKVKFDPESQTQIENIHEVLRSAGNVEDATDDQVWALLKESPGLLKQMRLYKASAARREYLSGSRIPVDPGETAGGASARRHLARAARVRLDPVFGAVGDPLKKLKPGQAGMLTPSGIPMPDFVESMGEGARDTFRRLLDLVPSTSPKEKEK